MIKIDFLKNHPEHIPQCIELWYHGLAKIWMPEACHTIPKDKFHDHLNTNCLPLTLIALENDKVVGMCSLRDNDGIREDLTPWLGSLVVDPSLQKRGIGKLLINAIEDQARLFNFNSLYLFAFDPNVAEYYARLGWEKIGMDEYANLPVSVMKINLNAKQ